MVLAFVAPVIIAVYTRGTDECTGIRIHHAWVCILSEPHPSHTTISSSLTSAEMNRVLPASGQSQAIPRSVPVRWAHRNPRRFAVERAEQFAVPVDEKFINGRTFITAVSVKSGIVDHHYRGGFILR